ncbi:hypothetical protein FGG78_34680, partial [Thioclava sp. BHET1]
MPGLKFGLLDAPELSARFDLVLAAGLADCLPVAEWERAAQLACPGGAFAALEERADIFALMTGKNRPADIAARLSATLKKAGFSVQVAEAACAEHMVLIAGRAPGGVAETVSVSVSGTGDLAAALRAASATTETQVAVLVLDRVEAASFRDLPEGTPLWLISEAVEQAAELTGWRRVLANETGRDLRSMTVAPGTEPARILSLIAQGREQELILTAERSDSPRVMPLAQPAPAVGAEDRLVLHAARRTATLDDLAWVAEPRRAPGEGEIEIEVAATALNFRDVMWGQGLIPPESLEGGFAGQGFGMECAGRVLRAGPGSQLMPGTPVVAFAPEAFASHVTVSEGAVMPLPEGMPLEFAAAAPVIFLTADYALSELARLERGEWILI